MATPQLSPGVIVREVDLTIGRADNVIDNIGAIAGPFQMGPVGQVVDIQTEQQLLDKFGGPISSDRQYEYWLSASSFLSYGGVLKVSRIDGDTLKNANTGVGTATTSVKVKNQDDYELNYSTASDWYFAARNPGSWSNGLKICMIDNAADQTIGIATTNPAGIGVSIGIGVTADAGTAVIPSPDGTLLTFRGYIKGIVTGIKTDSITGNSSFDVRVVSRVSTAGTETNINYAEGDQAKSFRTGVALNFSNAGGSVGVATAGQVNTVSDWYSQQTLDLDNNTIFWRTIAPKPTDSNFVTTRGGRNDGLHIAVIDDNGTVTGSQGSVLETYLNLSKATDATRDGEAGLLTYYKNFILNNSSYIFAGKNPSQAADAYWGLSPKASGFSTGFTPVTTGGGVWGQDSRNIQFSSIGNVGFPFAGGSDYAGNGMSPSLGDIVSGYSLFSNKEEVGVDYLIMGPGLSILQETQAKANYLISIANLRKDCIATISPHRSNVVNVTDPEVATTKILDYYAPISSSSYAVFDTGWKYTYDRYNDQFVYLPCNADTAGLMVRTSIVAFPWFSPAGQARGIINNAVKLAYNPNKDQRDRLYGARVNSIVTQRGIGSLLYGDKTGLGYASAFDRINVRRLFLTVEQALEGAANAQLFEVNDASTRASFVNIVEPYLRDVQAKRGLFDFLVVADETNNTPEVIDNNEFRADIFLKPTKSINYVTITFVATRTGISFEEAVGTV